MQTMSYIIIICCVDVSFLLRNKFLKFVYVKVMPGRMNEYLFVDICMYYLIMLSSYTPHTVIECCSLDGSVCFWIEVFTCQSLKLIAITLGYEQTKNVEKRKNYKNMIHNIQHFINSASVVVIVKRSNYYGRKVQIKTLKTHEVEIQQRIHIVTKVS